MNGYWVTAILAALALACLVVIGMMLPDPAHAHAWYRNRVDPVFLNTCCGGTDCAELRIDAIVLTAEEGGYRIRLTHEQAKKINPFTHTGIDALVPWNRVQDSEDGNFHICVMTVNRDNPRGGIYCLFVPPNG